MIQVSQLQTSNVRTDGKLSNKLSDKVSYCLWDCRLVKIFETNATCVVGLYISPPHHCDFPISPFFTILRFNYWSWEQGQIEESISRALISLQLHGFCSLAIYLYSKFLHLIAQAVHSTSRYINLLTKFSCNYFQCHNDSTRSFKLPTLRSHILLFENQWNYSVNFPGHRSCNL